MIKLVLSDLDGTLIDRFGNIKPKDIESVVKLHENHIVFGIVTGRDIGFCRHLLEKYDIYADCIICNNGGSMWVHDKKLLEYHMEADEVIDVMEKLRPFIGKCHPFICDENRIFYLMKNAYPTNKDWKDIRETLYYLGLLSEDDLITHLQETKAPVVKISMYTIDIPTTQYLLPILKEMFPEYEVYPTADDYIELTKRGIHKGKTLHSLMDVLNLSQDEVCVVGDGHNDIPMLGCVDLSCVMNTADDEVKAHGKRVVESVSEVCDIVLANNEKA